VISADLVVTTQPSNLNECVGGNGTISVTVSGGSGTITYQWQQSADGLGGWSNSTGTGATTANLYTIESQHQEQLIIEYLSMHQIMVADQAVSNNSIVVIRLTWLLLHNLLT
jgi:hypothetical protein